MRFKIDRRLLEISIYALFVIVAAILFEKLSGNFVAIASSVKGGFRFITGILSPFLYGFLIAYISNSLVRFIEKNLFGRIGFLKGRKKIARMSSILSTYIVIIGLVVWAIMILIPDIADSLSDLVAFARVKIQDIQQNGASAITANEDIVNFVNIINETFSQNYSTADLLNIVIEPAKDALAKLPSFMNTLTSGTISFARHLINFFLGLVISFYMLSEKEHYASSAEKLIFTTFKQITAVKILFAVKESNKTFEKFFIGKAIDSTIIGILFFIGAAIIKVPLLPLSSIIVGVTNMIPYFGPFIGAIPVIVVTLLMDPSKALAVTIFIFVLQQFDGIILGPKIIGDSTGLAPIWVILAILIGGALFGPLGMFFGVPALAVIKTMLTALLNRRYNEKYTPRDVNNDS